MHDASTEMGFSRGPSLETFQEDGLPAGLLTAHTSPVVTLNPKITETSRLRRKKNLIGTSIQSARLV